MDIAQRRFKVKLLLRGVMLQRFMVIFFIAVFGTGGAWGQIAPSQDLPVSEVYPVPELDFKQDLISPDLISPAQDYFGPVDISKISVKLLNQVGELVNLLDSEYSFSLEVTTVYDLNNPFIPLE